MTVDKEAIFNKEARQGMIEFNLTSFKTNYAHLYRVILSSMDEYAASLIKERDELKISLEMAQLGWNGTIDKKEEWENQAKALSAVKKGLEFMIEQQNTTIKELMTSNEAKEKECEYWKQLLQEILLEMEWGNRKLSLEQRIVAIFNKRPEITLGINVEAKALGLQLKQSITSNQ